VHERDLDIDFSLVVIKHLLNKEAEGFNFKLILMSATFNIELFANYFSKSSIKEIEGMQVYVGIEDKMKREEEERKEKLAKSWGPCKSEQAWNQPSNEQGQAMAVEEDDQWVDNAEMIKKNMMPVERRKDPADVVEINFRLFHVEDMYIDDVVDRMLEDD
jgi:HrpA-like RNA helicase